MRKKLLILFLCCLCCVVAAAGGAVWWATDHLRSPEFRSELIRLCETATGREVRITGRLTIRVFPWVGITAEGVSLGNDPAFGSRPLLTAGTVSASVKFEPLLHRRLVFDTVDLQNATLAMVLAKDDRGNWDSLVEHLRAYARRDDFFRTFTMRGLRIEGTRASLDDRRHGFYFGLTNVTLRAGRIERGRPMPFALACDFVWPQPGITSHVEGSGRFDWSGRAGSPVLVGATAQADIHGTFLPRGTQAVATMEVGTGRGNRDLVLNDLRLKLLGADFAGGVTFFDVTDRYSMAARLRARPFDPRAVVRAYWPNVASTKSGDVLRSVEGELDLEGDEKGMTFASPALRLDGSTLRGSVRMGYDTTPGLDFNLGVDRLNADAYLAALSRGPQASPLAAGDLPARYLRRLKGAGVLRAENFELAGVAMRGANFSWTAADGRHGLTFKLDRTRWGRAAGHLAAAISGGPADPETPDAKAAPLTLGLSGALRMDDVDVRQITWLNRANLKSNGQLDLTLGVKVPAAAVPDRLPLSRVLRRADVTVDANLNPVVLAFAPKGRDGRSGPLRRMAFSSIETKAHFVPEKGPWGDGGWAVRASGVFTAVGANPQLNLDTRISGRISGGAGEGAVLTGAAASGRLAGWFLPRRENVATFTLRGGADFSAQKLNVAALAVKTCGLNLTGALSGARVFSRDAALSGRIRCSGGDPKRLLRALDLHVPKSADKRVLAHLSGEADMVLDSQALKLTNIAAQFDDIPIRGSYSVVNFAAPHQIFALSAGIVDMDRYLPAPRPVRRGAPEEKPAPEPLPVEAVRSLEAEGSLNFHSFKLRKLTTRNMRLSLTAGGGGVVVKPIAGNFYGGTLSGEFTAKTAGQGLATRLSLVAKDFRAGPFMIAWGGREYVTGAANMFLDLGGYGATDRDVMRTLDGLAAFRVVDGAYAFSGASDRIPDATAGETRRRTAFKSASARFKVQGGVFQTKDFRLVGPGLVVTGQGNFSPAADDIAVQLTASMPGIPDVPLRVHGRLKDPEMEVHTVALFANTIKEILGLPFKPIKFFKDLLF